MEFDDDFFKQVGLNKMKAADRKAFGDYVRGLLEIRVGSRLTSQMTDQQVDHLNKLLDSPDKKVLEGWINQNLPNHKSMLAEEVTRLKSEIKANAPAILAASSPPPASSGAAGR